MANKPAQLHAEMKRGVDQLRFEEIYHIFVDTLGFHFVPFSKVSHRTGVTIEDDAKHVYSFARSLTGAWQTV